MGGPSVFLYLDYRHCHHRYPPLRGRARHYGRPNFPKSPSPSNSTQRQQPYVCSSKSVHRHNARYRRWPTVIIDKGETRFPVKRFNDQGNQARVSRVSWKIFQYCICNLNFVCILYFFTNSAQIYCIDKSFKRFIGRITKQRFQYIYVDSLHSQDF